MTKLGTVLKSPEIKNMSCRELWAAAAHEALEDGGVTTGDVEGLYIGNMIGELQEHQYNLGNLLGLWTGLDRKGGVRVEGACASAAHAIREGALSIASGAYDVVMAGGVEVVSARVNDQHPGDIKEMSRQEIAGNIFCHYDRGWEVPQMIAQAGTLSQWAIAYAKRYKLSLENLYDTLDAVTLSNYHNGVLNPKSGWKRSVEEVAREQGFGTPKEFLRSSVQNPVTWWPLRRWHGYRSRFDGAVAVILCSTGIAERFNDIPIRVVGTANTNSVSFSESMYTQPFFVKAAREAYEMAGIDGEDVGTIEVNDTNAAEYLIILEDSGFFPRGEAWKGILEGATRFEGDRPVNTGGGGFTGTVVGLLGAFGTYNIVKQLRGQAGHRQISPSPLTGVMFDVGAARNAVVNVYQREQ
jgi:acetyl-CoA C-acetyltransferase